jgi:hypothetical protein
MTLSPSSSSSSRIGLRNGGNNTPTSTTITVTFNTSSVPFTVAESGGGNHLTITKSGNSITIATKNGSTNRGNFNVVVTPTGCGSAQTIYINVAN